MHHRFLIPSLITCLSLSLLTACSNSQTQSPQSNSSASATWPDRCQQLKQELGKKPGTNLVYQPHPENQDIQSSWEMAWLGKRIPIPAIQYSKVIIANERPQDYLVGLSGTVNGQKVKVFLIQKSDKTSPNEVFSFISSNGGLQSTPEEQAVTKQLFGESGTANQLATLGYSHKVADLTCTTAQWEKEVPISLSLSLKTLDIHTPTSAYRLDQGSITHSQTDQQETWVVSWDDQRQSKQIMYQLPNGQTYGELGFGIDQANWRSAPDVPTWLTALEKALNTPNKSNWQSLAQAMETAGMPKESLDNVQKLINAN
jgi:hypothetical protein